MPELDNLYKVLSQDPKYDVGEKDYFTSKYSDADSLKKLHGILGQDDNYDAGDWEYFSGKYGGDIKKNTEQPSQSPLQAGWQERQQEVLGGSQQPSTEPSALAQQAPDDNAPPSGFRTSMAKGEQTQAVSTPDQIKVDNMEIDVKTPDKASTSFEYIAQQGAAGSLVFQGIDFLTHLDNALDLNVDKPFQYAKEKFAIDMGNNAENLSEYEPSVMDKIGSGLFGLSLDMGAGMFPAMGGVGKGSVSAVGKAGNYVKNKLISSGVQKGVANQTAKKVVLNQLAKGGAVSGVTLAQYGAGANFMEQMADPEKDITDINYSHVLKRAGQDFGLGMFAGIVGAGTNLVSHAPWVDKVAKSVAGRQAIKAGVDATGLVGEAGVFTLGGALIHGTPVTAEDFVVNLGIFAGLKAQGIPERFKKSENFTPQKRNQGEFQTELSKSEILDLNRGREVGTTTEAIIERITKDVGTLESVMSDPNVPWVTKAKLMHSSYGVMADGAPTPKTAEVRQSPDGRYIGETKDANGNVVERVYYNNAERAYSDAAYTDVVIKESEALRKTALMLPENYNKVNGELISKGVDNGLRSPELSEALRKHPSQRTKEEADISRQFVEITRESIPETPVKVPEATAEATNPKSEGNVPPKAESALKQPTGNKEGMFTEAERLTFEPDVSEIVNRPGEGLRPKTEELRRTVEEGKFGEENAVRVGETVQKILNSEGIKLPPAEKGGRYFENAQQAKEVMDVLERRLAEYETEIARRKEAGEGEIVGKGDIDLGRKRYETVEELKADLRKFEEGFPDTMDIRTMKAIEEVMKERESKAQEQTKTQVDEPVQKQSPTEVPMGDKPKVSKKVGEGDTKKQEAPKKEVDTDKTTYLAESAQEKVSITAPEFNAKAEKLRKRIEDTKADDKAKRQAIDTFLQQNQAKINEAGLNAGEVRALAKANTWKQVVKALGKVQNAIEKNTPKMRAAAMEDFIKAKQGEMGDLSARATEALLKKVNRASESDAKLDKAQAYIEELLSKKEVRQALEEKAKAISQIDKITSPKTVLEKRGKRPVVKRGLKSAEGDISDRLMEINELLNEGKSKKTPDVRAERERLVEELNSKSGDPEFEVRSQEIRDRLLELELADVDMLSDRQVKQALDYVKNLQAEGKSQAMAELEARKENRTKVTEKILPEVLGDKKIPSTWSMRDNAVKSRDKTFAWFDASWQSALSKIASRGKEAGGGRVFSDLLNQELSDRYVHPSEAKYQQLEIRKLEEFEGALKSSFGSTMKGKNAIVDALTEFNEITIDVNSKPQKIKINTRQALEKWLQQRDPELYEDLMRPRTENKQGMVEKGSGNGFTEQTLKEIDAMLSPEMKKFGEWMYENQKVWGEQVYNPVYRKINGIDISNFENGYWPSSKDRVAAYKQGDFMGSTVQPGILQNRAMRRTGVKLPIEYTDIVNTYMGYVSEASRYSAWAEAHRELSYILRAPEMRKAITYSQGTRANEIMDFYLNKFAGQSRRQTLDALDYMTNALGAGILGLKPLVGVKQIFSSVYYMTDMPAQVLAEGTVKAMSPGTIQHGVSEWLATDPFVMARKDAFLQRDIAMGNAYGHIEGGSKAQNELARLIAKSQIAVGERTKGMKKVQNAAIRVGDKMPITKAGSAYLTYKYQQYAGKKLTEQVLSDHVSGKKIDANLEKAKIDWLMQASMTQQSVRESNVSLFRSSGSLQRGLTQFTSGQAQIWRVEMDAIRKFRKAQRAGDKNGMANAAKNFMISHALSGLIFGMANARFQIKGNEKELIFSVLKGNLSGLALIGRTADYAYNKLLNKPWADKGLTDIPAASTVREIGTAAEYIIKEQKKDFPDQDKINKNAKTILENILTLNGIAVTGGETIVDGYKRLIEGESEYPLHDILGLGEPYEPDQAKSFVNE